MTRRDKPRQSSRRSARVRGHADGAGTARSADAAVEPASHTWFRLAAVAGLASSLVLYVTHAWQFRHYVNDDAFITFRYSRFLSLGLGPYFNVGEPVEGYSNPLLMLLMVPVIAWGGESAALPAAKIIGVLSGGLSLALAFALGVFLQRRAAPRVPGWIGGSLAAGLIAVAPSYAVNSMSGLETTLFAATIAAGVLLGTIGAYQGRWRGAGVAFAAGVLTRPEGALIFAAFWCAQAACAVVSRSLGAVRWPLAADAAIVGAVFTAQLIFRYVAYDGEWLPNTYYAKAGGFWGAGAWEYIQDGVIAPFGGLVAVAIAAAGCLAGMAAFRWIAPVAAVALTGALLPHITGTDWMPGERLLMPYLPIAAVLVAVGWVRIASMLIPAPVWLPPSLLLLLLPVLWASQGRSRTEMVDETAMRARGYERGHIAMAEWLRSGKAKPGDTIALMDIGIVGYLCIEQQILDITGLTDRHIARSPGGFLDKQYDPAYVFEREPRFIVLVIRQPGEPIGPPTGAGFATWTHIERQLLRHPDFNRWYRKPRAAASDDEPWLDALSRSFGAERMFLHDHPGVYYLLTVFERQDEPVS